MAVFLLEVATNGVSDLQYSLFSSHMVWWTTHYLIEKEFPSL